MDKDSVLLILPSYRLQIKDANRIFSILSAIVMLSNIMLLCQSNNRKIIFWVAMAVVFGLLAIFVYRKYLFVLLKSTYNGDYYLGAIIEYLFVLIGISPICIYLYVEQQWDLLNQYGTECFILFNTYENYLIPISIFLMISFTYWLIIYHLKKEGRLFYLLEKKKKEIYE